MTIGDHPNVVLNVDMSASLTLPERLSTAEVAAASGISVRALDAWARAGVYESTGGERMGQGRPRYWTEADLRVVKVLKALADANCPLRIMAAAAEALKVSGVRPRDTRWLLVSPDGVAEVVSFTKIQTRAPEMRAAWVISIGGALQLD
jgi:DNA-binding transcriptional MerR regulator